MHWANATRRGYRRRMKLTLRNLGRIQAAELDLRPLTVFVGRNNTNKSWAAYAAYLGFLARSLHEWLGSRRANAAPERWMLQFAGALMDGVLWLKDGESISKTYDQPFRQPVIPVRSDGVLADIIGIGPTGLKESWAAGTDLVGALRVEPDDTPVLVTSAEFRVSRSGSTFDLDVVLQLTGGRLERHRVTGLDEQRLRKAIQQHLHAASCHFLRTFFLPTERALLLQDVVSEATRDRFPLPVQDCDEWMREARQRHASGKPLGGDSELSALLQRAVGGGYAVDANQRMTFEGPGFSVPIASAASMARSLAGLSLYLDNLASPGDVLVIDEPEMNAHPEAQLAIVELFAAMVNRGYYVLFTTHSPYILDHLDNLLEAASLRQVLDVDDRTRVASEFALGTSEAFLDPQMVAAYEFVEQDDGSVEVVDILDREEAIIETRTFGRVSERLGQIMNVVLDAEQG